MWTQISGRMPASSQASSELSTASFTVVSRALRGLSKPSRWRFLAKNSLTEISRWAAAIDWAVARVRRLRPEGSSAGAESEVGSDSRTSFTAAAPFFAWPFSSTALSVCLADLRAGADLAGCDFFVLARIKVKIPLTDRRNAHVSRFRQSQLRWNQATSLWKARRIISVADGHL